MVRRAIRALALSEQDLIHSVPNHLVPDLWPAVEPHVTRALKHHPFMTAGDVYESILWGALRLFVATKPGGILGFACMEVVQYPSRMVANVLCAGGEHGFLSVAIHDLLPVLKAWGVEQGADTFALTGRPGWVRVLRDFEVSSHVTLWADLDEQGRRQQQKPNSDDGLRTLESGAALSH